MFRILTLAALVLFVGLAGGASAQDADQRTRDLVANLDKTKYKKKEKANVSVEVFVDVKNEPVVEDPPALRGLYEADGYRLDLNVEKSGKASGSGYDSYYSDDQRVNFTLEDARIDGALLTGTKVYASGESIPFEAVFVNRTSRTGTSPDRVTNTETAFGLGFLQDGELLSEHDPGTSAKKADKNIGWTHRVFLEKK